MIVLGIGMLAIREWNLMPDGKLHAYFLDVGQGDSALIVSPTGKQILIDGGPDLSPLEHLGTYMPFFDRDLDLLILSHPNLDHLTAFPEILRRYHIRRVLLTGVAYESLGRYRAMLHEITARHISLIPVDPTKDIDLGDDVTIDVIWPPAGLLGKDLPPSMLNDTSIALRVMYRNHAILFTGDMEEREERAILASHQDIRADILKVAHHGSKTSSSVRFLRAVNPRLAVISIGKYNPYGHPSRQIIERFRAMGIAVRLTESGTVALVLP